MNPNLQFISLSLIFVVILLLISRRSSNRRSLFGAVGSLTALCYFVDGVSTPVPFVFYLSIVVFHYYYSEAEFEAKRFLSPVLYPILFIFIIKYSSLPELLSQGLGTTVSLSAYFLGISYVSFRMSFYSHYRKAKKVAKFSLSEYLTYVFFLPTIMVGPITRPDRFITTWKQEDGAVDYVTCFERIVIGLVKFTLISQFFNQTTFRSLIYSDHVYTWAHVLLASASYYMFLYFNFSGFCDVAIGISALAKVDVEENFNRPLLSRNVQDFWSRWHMTLSNYMNEVVFAPLSISLMRKINLRYKNFTIVLCLAIIFILIGYWHGKELQYFIFGVLQAIAVSTNYLYAEFLKKKLGMKGYKAYLKHRGYRWASIFVTFLFMCFSFVIFANDTDKLIKIFFHLTEGPL